MYGICLSDRYGLFHICLIAQNYNFQNFQESRVQYTHKNPQTYEFILGIYIALVMLFWFEILENSDLLISSPLSISLCQFISFGSSLH